MSGLSGMTGLSGVSGLFGGIDIPLTIDGLQLWLKADAGTFQDSGKTSLAINDGDVIGAWEDQSGNDNDALQSTTANKPLLKLSIVNSRSIVRFDGTDDFLLVSLDLDLSASDNLTIFTVTKPVDTANTKSILGNQDNAGDRPGLALFHDVSEQLQFRTRQTAAAQTDIIAALADADFVLAVSQLTAGTQELFRNGASEGSAAQADMTGYDPILSLGVNRSTGTAVYDGDMAEILIYNTALSNSDRGIIENYLNERYVIF